MKTMVIELKTAVVATLALAVIVCGIYPLAVLAVAQGFDVAPQLGSCATHLRSGLGGLGGHLLAEGDVLSLHAAQAPAATATARAGRRRPRERRPSRVSAPAAADEPEDTAAACVADGDAFEGAFAVGGVTAAGPGEDLPAVGADLP